MWPIAPLLLCNHLDGTHEETVRVSCAMWTLFMKCIEQTVPGTPQGRQEDKKGTWCKSRSNETACTLVRLLAGE